MKLETLVDDIYALFDPNKQHTCSEENLNEFCENLKALIRTRLSHKPEDRKGEEVLRFSALGKPARQLWYDAHPDGTAEELLPKVYYKFLYGDVIEQLAIFLAKEAGHSVESQQAEIDVDGVKGHVDAIIDGILVDVKSASPYGYQKLVKGEVFRDDPFGYVAQLSGYADVLTPGKSAAWLVVEKVSGDISVVDLPEKVISENKPTERIALLRDAISQPEPPERCYEPVPDGASGNMKLPTGCSYCRWKFRCHPGLRTFLYSNGPRFLTKVVRTPDVREVTEGVSEFPD
jgi:hypothetical protein